MSFLLMPTPIAARRLFLGRSTGVLSGTAVALLAGGSWLTWRWWESHRPRVVAYEEIQKVEVKVDAREVDQPTSRDEELLSPYVTDGVLDVSAWAHDALALVLPSQVLCRPECAGLCPVCGVSLNDVDRESHRHETTPDPRLAKLRELLD